MVKRILSNSQNLWLMRLLFLTLFIAMGSFLPFVNLFYVHRHLTGTEIGILGTISSLAALCMAPVWGRFSDSAENPRRLLQLTIAGSAVVFFIMSLQTSFLFIALFVGAEALLGSGAESLRNAQAVIVAEQANAGYGSIRLWGSLGWAIAAPISGWIIQRTGIQAIFYIYAAAMLASVLVLLLITTPGRRLEIPGEVTTTVKLSMFQVAREVWKNRELMGLIVASVVMWAATNGTKFESVYMAQLGAKESVIGWVNTVAGLTEIPFMILADKFVRRRGPVPGLILAFSLNALSMVFLLVYPSIAAFFVMKIIFGIANSFYIVSFIPFIVKRAPAQQSATMLALYSTTLLSLVNILMSPVSGFLFDVIGAYWLYVMAFGGHLAGGVILYFTIARRPKAING